MLVPMERASRGLSCGLAAALFELDRKQHGLRGLFGCAGIRRPQQIKQFLFRTRLAHDLVGTLQKSVRNCAFLFMHGENFFFHRAGHDEAVHVHRAFLPVAMCAVGRLILHGGIPPRIKMNNIIRRSQIQAQPPRFKTDEENIAVLPLKCFYLFFA